MVSSCWDKVKRGNVYLSRRAKIAYDWTYYRLIDFQRYYKRHVWRSGATLREYSNRKNQRPVFADLLPKEAIT